MFFLYLCLMYSQEATFFLSELEIPHCTGWGKMLHIHNIIYIYYNYNMPTRAVSDL